MALARVHDRHEKGPGPHGRGGSPLSFFSLLFLLLVCMLVGGLVWISFPSWLPWRGTNKALSTDTTSCRGGWGWAPPTRPQGYSRHSNRTVTCSSRLPHWTASGCVCPCSSGSGGDNADGGRGLTGYLPEKDRPCREAFPVRLRAHSEAGKWGLPENSVLEHG